MKIIFVNWYHQPADDNLILLFVEVMGLLLVLFVSALISSIFPPDHIALIAYKAYKNHKTPQRGFYLAETNKKNSINQLCIQNINIHIICFSFRSLSLSQFDPIDFVFCCHPLWFFSLSLHQFIRTRLSIYVFISVSIVFSLCWKYNNKLSTPKKPIYVWIYVNKKNCGVHSLSLYQFSLFLLLSYSFVCSFSHSLVHTHTHTEYFILHTQSLQETERERERERNKNMWRGSLSSQEFDQ